MKTALGRSYTRSSEGEAIVIVHIDSGHTIVIRR